MALNNVEHFQGEIEEDGLSKKKSSACSLGWHECHKQAGVIKWHQGHFKKEADAC